MPSPFPGMNPYFEQAVGWSDFHSAYIARLRTELIRLVRPRYAVRIGERVYLRERPDPVGLLIGLPDLNVLSPPRLPAAGPPTAVLAPATVALPTSYPIREREQFLEVTDLRGDRLVTVVELLSPSNKYAGSDRDQYLAKRHRLVTAGVNFVELDFLRGGPRVIERLPAADYYVVVARSTDHPTAGVWPVRLREPLPTVPLPLRSGEPEPPVDFQAVLHAVYDDGGYADFLYRGEPEPRLSPDDAAWARALIPGGA